MSTTISINKVKELANDMLRDESCSSENRQGVIQLLCALLHESGNYHGFSFLTASEVPEGSVAGIVWSKESGADFEGTDNTRVKFL